MRAESVSKGQLALPLEPNASLTREDFVVGPSNAAAMALIESWPSWSVPAVAIHGPRGCGKTHLLAIWRNVSGARLVMPAELADRSFLSTAGPVAIDNIEDALNESVRAETVFHILERATPSTPVLLAACEPPARWPTVLPDLASRFSALANIAIWQADEMLLAGVARKLFADRQLAVPEAVIDQMLRSLERSPGAVRDFVALVDRKALEKSKPVSVAFVRELLGQP